MEQESEEIRSAFPEYLTNTQEDGEHLDQCLQQFETLFNNYKDELNILSAIESKITMVVNQTPMQSIIDCYENIAKDYNLQTKMFRVSKFHDQKCMPQVPILIQYLDSKIKSLPWPIIGDVNPNQLQEQMIKLYNFNYGRIALHELLLLWFPSLIKPYCNVIGNLLNTQTKLSQDEKYYFAIMGAAASGSDQLYDLLIQHFYLNEGEKNWVELGYESIDEKIKSVDTICKILVQKPWEQSLKNTLQQIIKNNKWNKRELIQALMIFIFYNNIGCFSQGNGILKEIDYTLKLQSGNTSISFTFPQEQQQQQQQIDLTQNEYIIQELKNQVLLDAKLENPSYSSDKNLQFKSKQQSVDEPQGIIDLDEEQLILKFKEKFQKYFTQGEIKDSTGYQILRFSVLINDIPQEYNFQMNSYPVLKSIYPEGAQTLHDFLLEVKQMTRNTFGKEQQITTAAFRKAIRVYAQNIYRYQHDDIDYSTQMNKLLPKELKAFIKIVSLTPNLLQKKHLEAIPLKLSPDELCHITLLSIAAKIEVQLIYLSKALVDCM
ncbi:unnamed protein product (macronuclear) [Paramecium tetraurelia]|uniref:Uncharacterized protein n=1 Tax=Paramecium tetraurelia TaxID=5888 RepID=A0C4J8_PARTE|nr:uncharacterized protein GSPATT00006213001 [Paramecium tetraurelia]CAK65715.1 unnamed protein product [Paramecium tetraurelia]|eukprot:XP_001433112.1 hypothetical protein (macronuclear) [Paramecium tetraurelia strain d4-2]